MNALVTGAAGGIGRRLTTALAARGIPVTATDFDEEGLARCARDAGWPPERVTLRPLDVRDAEAWRRCIDEATRARGPLTLGFNVAGCIVGGPALEQGPDDVARLLDVNARGTILGTQSMARAMLPHRNGHIVNFGSMTALMPSPGYAVYCASKYAVRGFSLSIAEELRDQGIAVTLVSTGSVNTAMLDSQRARQASMAGASELVLSPEEVAEVVLSPRVLRRRPREVYLPLHKGLVARGVDLWPGGVLRLVTRLRR